MAAELMGNGDSVDSDFERVMTIYTLKAVTKTEIEEWIEDAGLIPTRCYHEYDCCGNMYRNYQPDIIRLTRTQDGTGRMWWEVRDTLYRNV